MEGALFSPEAAERLDVDPRFAPNQMNAQGSDFACRYNSISISVFDFEAEIVGDVSIEGRLPTLKSVGLVTPVEHLATVPGFLDLFHFGTPARPNHQPDQHNYRQNRPEHLSVPMSPASFISTGGML